MNASRLAVVNNEQLQILRQI